MCVRGHPSCKRVAEEDAAKDSEGFRINVCVRACAIVCVCVCMHEMTVGNE